jgi:hypothetical protein
MLGGRATERGERTDGDQHRTRRHLRGRLRPPAPAHAASVSPSG